MLVSGGAVVVPVKAFEAAKQRLGPVLEPRQRAQLARELATRVVKAQQHLPVAVCCDSPDVAAWARSMGAETIWCEGTGLNGAVAQGLAHLRRAGFDEIAVVHGDLPLAASLAPLFGWPGVTLVPDRHRTGTNVAVIPSAIDFGFSYGVGSFGRHVAEAVRHRVGLRIVHDAALGWDIDEPADLEVADAGLLPPASEASVA